MEFLQGFLGLPGDRRTIAEYKANSTSVNLSSAMPLDTSNAEDTNFFSKLSSV